MPPGERKNVCSSTKMPSASGGLHPPDPHRGLCPLDPRYRLALPLSPYCGLKPTLLFFPSAATASVHLSVRLSVCL